MKKGFLNLLVVLMLGALTFSACSKAPATDVDPNGENSQVTENENGEENSEENAEEATEWTEKPEVAFSTLGQSVMSSKYYANDNPNGYKEFWLKEGTGSCVEQGLPTEIGYVQDEELGYSIVRSADGSYREEWASLDFTGRIGFGKVSLADDVVAKCTAFTTAGSDDANVVCEAQQADESYVEVCTADFKVTASK